jgi:hypothetical protein
MSNNLAVEKQYAYCMGQVIKDVHKSEKIREISAGKWGV